MTTDPSTGDRQIQSYDVFLGSIASTQTPSQSLGLTQPTEPTISWHGSGKVFFNGNSANSSDAFVSWDPSHRPNPPPEPPIAHPVVSTPLVPSNHNCAKLEKIAVGPEFAAVEGSGCGQDGDENQLFVVATRDDEFVYRDDTVYQVFTVDDWVPGTMFDVKGSLLAYEGDVDGLKIVGVNRRTTGSLPPYEDPMDNNPWNLWYYVYPWNVGAQVGGHVDYSSGGLFDEWRVRLLTDQSYRILAVGYMEGVDEDCSNSLTDTYLEIYQDDRFVEWADVNLSGIWSELSDCAGLVLPMPDPDDVSSDWVDYDIRVSRYWPGAPGAPALNYRLYIQPF
ncbi:MAG TPA: hypothetical protein VN033_01925 [Vulgatibacter sp.]|nr:hypothetical protein [Vulgatibacter sp.]